MKQVFLYACIAMLCIQCAPTNRSIIANWQPKIPDKTDTAKLERYWYSRAHDLHTQDSARMHKTSYLVFYLFEPKNDLRFTDKGDYPAWKDAILIAELKSTQCAVTVQVVNCEKKFL